MTIQISVVDLSELTGQPQWEGAMLDLYNRFGVKCVALDGHSIFALVGVKP